MKKRKLIWQVYPSYLLLAVVAVIAVASYASVAMSKLHHAQTRDALLSAARLAAEECRHRVVMTGAPPGVEFPDTPEIDRLCKSFGQSAGYRFTIVHPSGQVLGDSMEEPNLMENHGDRREIQDAQSRGTGVSTRYSHTLGMQMMYVAVPVVMEGRTNAVVRTSLSLAAIDRMLLTMWHRIGVAVLVIACIAALLSYGVSRKITRPLEEIREGADGIGHGDLGRRIPPSGVLEMDALAGAMNTMAAQLDERIRTVTQQRDEQNALLSCMVESVLAVDTDKRLLKMNRSAEILFRTEASCYGKNVMDVIRNTDLLEMINRALGSSEPVEGSVFLADDQRTLQAHGTVLKNADGNRIGALVVLNDVTRIRQLENIRRDFVANVSHELKTPVTSIKGFVETLQEGAARKPEDLERFLGILSRQADRLNSIVNDLLSLSRMEHDVEKNGVELAVGPVCPVLRDAMEVCDDRARKKNIRLTLSCTADLTALINAPLLEQAVVNLIDNAVKYSGDNTVVEIAAGGEGGRVVIRVRDQGPGIETVHLSRVFERFYRVDKGRSRQLGGTGLGLAIVKHVALAHKGDVGVESTPGQGSVFFIYLLPSA